MNTGMFYTFNEILEATMNDYAEVMSAAKAVSLHKCLVGKPILMAESSLYPRAIFTC